MVGRLVFVGSNHPWVTGPSHALSADGNCEINVCCLKPLSSWHFDVQQQQIPAKVVSFVRSCGGHLEMCIII